MKLTKLLILISIFVSCADAYGATFKGKVIDADTKEPIEGAVVVASWNESTATIAGPSTRFKDVKETLTDKNGEWRIRGPKGDRFIAQVFAMIPGLYYTKSPEFIIFKPGYCSYRQGFRIDACKEKMGPYAIGNGEVTKLPKLTKREDRLKALPTPKHKDGDSGIYRKQINYLKLIDEESKYLGIPEYNLLKELADEK